MATPFVCSTRRSRVARLTHQQRLGDTKLNIRLDCYYPAVPDLPIYKSGGLRPASRRKTASYLGVALLLAMTLSAPTSSAAGLAGMAVFLDPGHNGVYDSSTTRQVPNGRGGTKQCNTTGTATNDGYAEHALSWDVTLRVRDALNALGARTEMSRNDDKSVGPCVDQRAALANAMHPDAIVSIHADGGPPTGHGFHVNYSSPPLNAAQGGPAVRLAQVMDDSLASAGLQPSTYIGSDGLYGRADLAGLNLAEFPAVLVELGNMKNVDDATRMQSADGRAKYAAAVTEGIVAYLSGIGPHS
jgi:N-acetylmuramoyl-L-alanine amidase